MTMPSRRLVKIAREVDRYEAIDEIRAINVETHMSLSGNVPGKTPRHIKEGNKMRRDKMDALYKRALRGLPGAENGTKRYIAPRDLKAFLAETHMLST